MKWSTRVPLFTVVATLAVYYTITLILLQLQLPRNKCRNNGAFGLCENEAFENSRKLNNSLKSLALGRQTTTEPPSVSIDPTSKKPDMLATFPTRSTTEVIVLDLIATDPTRVQKKFRNIGQGIKSLVAIGRQTTTEPPNVSIDPTSKKPGLLDYTLPTIPSMIYGRSSTTTFLKGVNKSFRKVNRRMKTLVNYERQTTTEPPNVSIDPTSKKPDILATFPTRSTTEVIVLDLTATDPTRVQKKFRNIGQGIKSLVSIGRQTTTEPPNVSIDPTSKKPGLLEDTLPTIPSMIYGRASTTTFLKGVNKSFRKVNRRMKTLVNYERQTTTEPPNVSIDPTSKKPDMLATFPTRSTTEVIVLDLIATDPTRVQKKFQNIDQSMKSLVAIGRQTTTEPPSVSIDPTSKKPGLLEDTLPTIPSMIYGRASTTTFPTGVQNKFQNIDQGTKSLVPLGRHTTTEPPSVSIDPTSKKPGLLEDTLPTIPSMIYGRASTTTFPTGVRKKFQNIDQGMKSLVGLGRQTTTEPPSVSIDPTSKKPGLLEDTLPTIPSMIYGRASTTTFSEKNEVYRNINNGLESVGGWTSTEPPNVSIDPTSKKPLEYRDTLPTLPTYPSKVRANSPAKTRAMFGITPRKIRDPIVTSSTITAKFENMMTEATKFFTRRSKYELR